MLLLSTTIIASLSPFPEEPRFRGAFSQEMADFHRQNGKGVGKPGKPVELSPSDRVLCGSEYYSGTYINRAAVCVCVGDVQGRRCSLCSLCGWWHWYFVHSCLFATCTQLGVWLDLQKGTAAATALRCRVVPCLPCFILCPLYLMCGEICVL